MNSPQSVQAVKYEEWFRAASWAWLGDAEVRRLTMAPSFTQEQQMGRLELNPSEICLVSTGDILGVRDCWEKGIGRWMINHALETVRQFGLVRLELRVRADNERAIQIYWWFQFQE